MRSRKKKSLEIGMVYCKSCNGNGIVKFHKHKRFLFNTNKCDDCKGIGQITWVDNITKRHLDEPPRQYSFKQKMNSIYGTFIFGGKINYKVLQRKKNINKNIRFYQNIKSGTSLGTITELSFYQTKYFRSSIYNPIITTLKI